MFGLRFSRILLGLTMMVVAVMAVACGEAVVTPTVVVPTSTSVPVEPTSTTVPAQPTSTAAPPEPTATVTTTADGDVMISFRRTGGFIGENMLLVIQPDGTATVTNSRTSSQGTTFKLSAGLWSRIQTAAKAIDWASLADEYKRGVVADGYNYELTYTAGGIDKTVLTETEGGAPDDLQALIVLLEEALAEANTVDGGETPVTSPTPGPTTEPAAMGGVLVYHQTGGIAGIDQYVYVRPDGSVTVSSSRPEIAQTFQLDETLWAELQAAIGGLDWGNLESDYTPQVVVSDGFYYELSYFNGDFSKTVRTETLAVMPPALETLLASMGEVIQAASSEQTATPEMGKRLIYFDYISEGGLAGREVRVQVLEDGSVYRTESRPVAGTSHYTLPADMWAGVQQAAGAIDWSTLDTSYVPADPAPDGITYTLTYLGTDGHRTVRTATGADLPRELQLLLTVLEQVATQ